ncbi:LOW QUALITY PROTEIN: hypothetical protein OSB04_027918 [Centaurea solstitialis]|uniref:FMR1-interacting protein 1 conserved domain-containing protein n=1 Tax=Centaurea solstitialis TaxID=347529 RepID=A0AA38W051_9ASTR|nr:LOW QUALITY PROTEIN: hypothetical protein OSB04_027918 [Centaurea solstitialis]
MCWLADEQVNSVINQQQQVCNNGNSRPIVAPSGFMNFPPNQPPFPLQNTMGGQFPFAGFNPQQNFNNNPFPQFNPSQQQQGQFSVHNNSMNPNAYNQNVNQQLILHNTIQNICQLLQLQNHPPVVNLPMFQNQIPNVMNHQNPGFFANQQLPNMGQGNPFLPQASGSVQSQQALATVPNFQHQISQGMGPQNHSYPQNQLFGMANSNGPGQPVHQGQQRLVAPMMDVNASRQMANTGQQGNLLSPHASASVQNQNPHPTLPNFKDNHGNMPANGNARWTESQRKNFTGNKKNDVSHKGFKSQFQHAKHVKEKFGTYNGNMNKEGNNNAAVNSGPPNSTNQIHSEKKFCVKYTEQEVKQWREARKKHYPSSANVEKKCKKEQALFDVTNQEAILRRQQLQEILTKQAELGCEVADVPSYYLSGPEKQRIPRGKKQEREEYKKGKKKKFQDKKRGRAAVEGDDEGMTKKTRQDSANNNNKPKQRPSLLQKLLTRDIKRDKNHLLQVHSNQLFLHWGDSLRFPSVIVRETNADVALETASVSNVSEKVVDVYYDDGKCNGELEKPEEDEEGEITD